MAKVNETVKELVSQIKREIDQVVYGLREEEIAVVKGSGIRNEADKEN